MKLVAAILLLLLYHPLQGQDLSTYQWKNRLVILVGDTTDVKLKEQKSVLQNHKTELVERDILILPIANTENFQIDLEANFKGLLLIGKDGGVKLKRAFPVAMTELFEIIDNMPMRKAEIKRDKG